MHYAMKQPTPLSSAYLTVLGHQLRKLGSIFRHELDETETLTYMERQKA